MANEEYAAALLRRIETLRIENESVLKANRRLDTEIKRIKGLLDEFVGGENKGEKQPPEPSC